MPIKLSIPYTFVQTANSSEVPLLFEEQWPWNIPKTKWCVGYFWWKFYPRVITLVCRACEICSFFCLWVVIYPFFFFSFDSSLEQPVCSFGCHWSPGPGVCTCKALEAIKEILSSSEAINAQCDSHQYADGLRPLWWLNHPICPSFN